jgi:hypothetical protein
MGYWCWVSNVKGRWFRAPCGEDMWGGLARSVCLCVCASFVLAGKWAIWLAIDWFWFEVHIAPRLYAPPIPAFNGNEPANVTGVKHFDIRQAGRKAAFAVGAIDISVCMPCHRSIPYE